MLALYLIACRTGQFDTPFLLRAGGGYLAVAADGAGILGVRESAGFPWTFAFWNSGELRWFDRAALTADLALGLAVVIVVAWLCSWSRGRTSAAEPVVAPDPRRQ
jgi:hypothetical protein